MSRTDSLSNRRSASFRVDASDLSQTKARAPFKVAGLACSGVTRLTTTDLPVSPVGRGWHSCDTVVIVSHATTVGNGRINYIRRLPLGAIFASSSGGRGFHRAWRERCWLGSVDHWHAHTNAEPEAAVPIVGCKRNTSSPSVTTCHKGEGAHIVRWRCSPSHRQLFW